MQAQESLPELEEGEGVIQAQPADDRYEGREQVDLASGMPTWLTDSRKAAQRLGIEAPLQQAPGAVEPQLARCDDQLAVQVGIETVDMEAAAFEVRANDQAQYGAGIADLRRRSPHGGRYVRLDREGQVGVLARKTKARRGILSRAGDRCSLCASVTASYIL